MTDDIPDKLTPAEGRDILMGLNGKVTAASSTSDNAALETVIGDLGKLVTATGLDMPDIQDQLTALAGENAKIQLFNDNFDAAMWAGDLDRANAMNQQGVPLDCDNIPGVNAPMHDDFTDDAAYTEDVAEDDPQMIELLTKLAADTALPDLYADIAEGRKGAIDAFIASGADPNQPRGDARHTALLAALDAPGRRAEQIEQLIQAGADPKVIHADGDNALSWSMGYHHPDTVNAASETALMQLLAEHGADPNFVAKGSGWTPLHRAIVQGDVARVTGALAAGGTITDTLLPDYEPEKFAGFTPLMLAAPKPDVVQFLLDQGANPSAKDSHGRLPLDVIGAEADAAKSRADAADPWTMTHAEALETSCRILAKAIKG